MTEKLRRWIIIGPAVALVLLPVLIYALDIVRSNGEVARNVSAAGIDLGGLGEEDTLAALREYEAQLAGTPAVFSVNGQEFTLDPRTIGLDVDEQSVLDVAMQQRRNQNAVAGFFSWFGSFSDQIELDVPVTLDADKLDEVLEEWEAAAIDLPAYQGGVIIRDTRALPDYPRPGEGIDRDQAQAAVLASLQTIDRRVTVLDTRMIQPELTNADIDAATLEATRLIDAPVTLASADPEFSITFDREQLAAALRADVRNNSAPEVVLSFDPESIQSILLPFRSEIEQPARDAEFLIDEDAKEVTLLPSRPATLLDAELVAAALLNTAANASNSGDFPFAEGAQPAFTTAEAEAMGDIGFISEFTTSHPAGQQRVTNIHLIADAIDGAVVLPGEEFSINDHVGQRTAEKGYVPAPMILGGELVDDVGGGVSQFATTFYNAVFYGCYEVIEHKPHSYYSSGSTRVEREGATSRATPR